eukprot:TRINITY_DN22483_c0_g1_i1.p1 TRINITY_DN22483_c0_g1~~TRINITY_DN22483_c0_g1_i1.p1  ORF type:complete len:123 (-),score=9.69 TRINITY_DN22483_c0_g1_i1:140-508(-)
MSVMSLDGLRQWAKTVWLQPFDAAISDTIKQLDEIVGKADVVVCTEAQYQFLTNPTNQQLLVLDLQHNNDVTVKFEPSSDLFVSHESKLKVIGNSTVVLQCYLHDHVGKSGAFCYSVSWKHV